MSTSHGAGDSSRDRDNRNKHPDNRNDNQTTEMSTQTTEIATQPLSPQHSSIPLSHTRTWRPPRVGIHPLGNAPSPWRTQDPLALPCPSLPSLMGSFNHPPIIWCLVFSRCSTLVSLAASPLKDSQEPVQRFC